MKLHETLVLSGVLPQIVIVTEIFWQEGLNSVFPWRNAPADGSSFTTTFFIIENSTIEGLFFGGFKEITFDPHPKCVTAWQYNNDQIGIFTLPFNMKRELPANWFSI